jgi:hypothetical protein
VPTSSGTGSVAAARDSSFETVGSVAAVSAQAKHRTVRVVLFQAARSPAAMSAPQAQRAARRNAMTFKKARSVGMAPPEPGDRRLIDVSLP